MSASRVRSGKSAKLMPEAKESSVPGRFGITTFARNTSGQFAPLFGLLSVVMVLLIGSGVDLARWLRARTITVAALDSAVLAAGRMLQVSALDEEAALATADRFYRENTKDRPETSSDTITFVTTEDGTAITAVGSAMLSMTFLRLAGIEEWPLLKLSGAEHSKATLAVGGNAEHSIEISLMLDVSGSMGSGTKFADMKAAAKDLVNVVVYENQGAFYSKVGIVPFSSYVRPPEVILNDVRGPGPFADQSPRMANGKTVKHKATKCVSERVGDQRYTDAAPGAGQYVMPSYWSSATCEMGAESEIVPLSSDKEMLKSRIDGLSLSGSTAGHLGTAWAWYLLSPNWNSVFAGNSQAGAYGDDKLKKIAVLMTDGEYNTQYCSGGAYRGIRDKNSYGTNAQRGDCTAANGSSATQAVQLCTGMKAAGITVYTVGFDLGGNQQAIQTLETCATDPTKFYNAATGDQLKQAFRDIAVKVSSLYLTR